MYWLLVLWVVVTLHLSHVTSCLFVSCHSSRVTHDLFAQSVGPLNPCSCPTVSAQFAPIHFSPHLLQFHNLGIQFICLLGPFVHKRRVLGRGRGRMGAMEDRREVRRDEGGRVEEKGGEEG